EFMACNPKDYDGKGGAIVYTHWIKKMESVQDMSGCGANQKVKYTASSFIDFKGLMRKEFCLNNELQKLESEFWCQAMVEAGHAVYTDRFHELARLVPHLVTPENKRIERYIYGLALQICAMVATMEPTIIQSVVLKAGMLTIEEIRNGSLTKNTKKIGNGAELSRDGNVRDDNKRSRTGRAFTIVTNPVRKEYTGTIPKFLIQENGTSRSRSTETSEGFAAIQAQLNNLRREIKKVNEKVYAAQVGCEQCKGSHYTKDYLLKEEGKTLEEAYCMQFGGPFQGGGLEQQFRDFIKGTMRILRTKNEGNLWKIP
ncbi:reverse transcriptase domain-containing protein, partial [Tanacetum coccineum]